MYKRISFQSIFGLFLLLGVSTLNAQITPNVKARFANPEFNQELGIYSVDVQLQAEKQTQHLYSFNVRFFYDHDLMEFEQLSDFANAYQLMGEEPRHVLGTANSGREYFSMSGAAAFVNTAVQLAGSESDALPLRTDSWSTAFKVQFRVKNPSLNVGKDFCPSIVWDLEQPQKSRGGFLPNDDGIVFTVLEKNPATIQKSTYSYSSAATFNWQYNNRQEKPYGLPVAEQCVSLGVATSLSNPLEMGYEVHQNRPNPFDSETFIGFSIPKAEKVKLRIMDASGKTLVEQTGNYEAGFHNIRIIHTEALLGASQVLFYRLETDDFISRTFTMNHIKQ